MTYTIWNRVVEEEKEITEQEALKIVKRADLYAGPYGYMGLDVDLVLYECQEEDQEDEQEYIVVAVRYKGEWLEIPRHQTPYISHELSEHAFEYRHGGYRPGAGRPSLPEDEIRKTRAIKFTDAEWEKIKKKADAEGLSASEYIRTKALQ